MYMTIIKALEKLAELNNYDDILVKPIVGEPTLINFAIEDARNFAEDPDEIFDLHVTEDSIVVLDENGDIKSGEALYRVIREE